MEDKSKRTVRERIVMAPLGKHLSQQLESLGLVPSSWCRDAFCNLLFPFTERSEEFLHTACLLGQEAEPFLLIAGPIPRGQRHKKVVLGPSDHGIAWKGPLEGFGPNPLLQAQSAMSVQGRLPHNLPRQPVLLLDSPLGENHFPLIEC